MHFDVLALTARRNTRYRRATIVAGTGVNYGAILEVRRSRREPVNNYGTPSNCNLISSEWTARRTGKDVLSIVHTVKHSQPCS